MQYSYQTPLHGKKIGCVFGSFAPLHQGHLDMIMRAKKECDGGCIVIVCGFEGDKGEPLMPHKKRYRYVREFFADDPLVFVYAINDSELGCKAYPYGWPEWLKEFRRICREDAHINPDAELVWYVGDKNYDNDLKNWGETSILVNRFDTNPICATVIRKNPILHWDKITFPFRRIFSTNILIIGTASEGKTTMTADLGKYFNAPYSWEWARDYMRESCVNDWELDSADFIAFLDGQYNLNKKLINSPANHGIFFSDSDALTTKMYAEMYSKDPRFAITPEEYLKVAAVADELTRKSRWDKIFLLAPHGVFVNDNERCMDHASMESRMELYELLVKHMKDAGLWDKVTILDGGYYKNFVTVVNWVKGVIENGKEYC